MYAVNNFNAFTRKRQLVGAILSLLFEKKIKQNKILTLPLPRGIKTWAFESGPWFTIGDPLKDMILKQKTKKEKHSSAIKNDGISKTVLLRSHPYGNNAEKNTRQRPGYAGDF